MSPSQRDKFFREKIAEDPAYAIADALLSGRLREADEDERALAIGRGVVILLGLGRRGWDIQKLQR